MRYGMEILTKTSSVIADEKYFNYSRIYQGQFVTYFYPTNDAYYFKYLGGGTVHFPAPINTQDPPLIGINWSTSNANISVEKVTNLGSPYAWTGFSLSFYTDYDMESLEIFDVKWRCWTPGIGASFSGNQGLQVYDINNRIVFDGTLAYMQVDELAMSYSNKWNLQSVTPDLLGARMVYAHDIPPLSSSYLLISFYSRVCINNPLVTGVPGDVSLIRSIAKTRFSLIQAVWFGIRGGEPVQVRSGIIGSYVMAS